MHEMSFLQKEIHHSINQNEYVIEKSMISLYIWMNRNIMFIDVEERKN